MSLPDGVTSLAEKRVASGVGEDLTKLCATIKPKLDAVRSLIAERVFGEEGFDELLLTAGSKGKWGLPDWLQRMIRSSNGPLPSKPDEMARHLTSRSGKLFRATLVLYIVEALRPEEKKGPKLAAAMELIHLATLIHDDVIDRADIRRGVASLPSLYDNGPTVLMGDHLFARAFELIAECENMDIISSSCRATSAMCRGEIEQLQWIGREDIPEDVYFDLICKKTAALMGCCTESAALLCGCDKERAGDWYRFGVCLGLVFQMTDDLLDFIADESVLGKPVGSDLEEGKYTLPLILLRERLPGGVSEFRSLVESLKDSSEIQHFLEKEGIFAVVLERIRDVAGSCHQQLRNLSDPSGNPEAFQPLHVLVDFLISRNH